MRLATGAGLEPAPPACAGALAVKLPCIRSSLAPGSGNLDMYASAVHLGFSPMYASTVHTGPSSEVFRMYGLCVRGVRFMRTGFCFFRTVWRGV